MKDKNCVVNSIDAEKVFHIILYLFMIKTQQSRYRENILQYNKDTYDKPTANVILDDEKLKAFPLR